MTDEWRETVIPASPGWWHIWDDYDGKDNSYLCWADPIVAWRVIQDGDEFWAMPVGLEPILRADFVIAPNGQVHGRGAYAGETFTSTSHFHAERERMYEEREASRREEA